MRSKPPKLKLAPFLRPGVGKIYGITNYHTGDFVATCIEQLFQTDSYRVNAPLDCSLNLGDEIEIAYRTPAHNLQVPS